MLKIQLTTPYHSVFFGKRKELEKQVLAEVKAAIARDDNSDRTDKIKNLKSDPTWNLSEWFKQNKAKNTSTQPSFASGLNVVA